ncbi:hypothetical protein Tco_0734211 [Tanacetum coccineum]
MGIWHASVWEQAKNTTPSAKLTEELPLIAMICEINLIGGLEGWWVDCGATIQVCYDRNLEESGLELPSQQGRVRSWADLFTLTKNGMFVGKGYATDGMFKLNAEVNKVNVSPYML